MDEEFDALVRNLPANFEDEMITDEIIRNLPPDYEEKALAERRVENTIDEVVRGTAGMNEGASTSKRRLPAINEGASTSKQQADPDPGEPPNHKRPKKACPTCDKELSLANYAEHRRLHESTCYDCPFCSLKGTKSLKYLRLHCRKFHSNAKYKCPKCHVEWATEKAFFGDEHMGCIRCEERDDEPLEPLPGDDTPAFMEDPKDPPEITHPLYQDPHLAPYRDEEEVVSQLVHYWRWFRQRFNNSSPLVQEYQFRTAGTDMVNFTLPAALRFIYGQVNATFNFNIGITTLLQRETEDGETEYRVFAAENNRQNVFERNLLVHDLASLEDAEKKLDDLGDLTEYLDKPESKWKIVAVLGVTFFVYIRPNFVAGKGNSRLPNWLTCNKKTVLNMERNLDNNIYADNLCLFRCLIAGTKEGDPHDLDTVLRWYEQYRSHVNGPAWRSFQGVPEDHLPLVEEIFNVNVQIYRKSSKNNCVCLRVTTNVTRPIINVHSHPIDGEKVHFSLITNLTNFAGKHHCQGCGKMFKLSKHLVQHQLLNCKEGETEYTYKDGCYEAKSSIFDQMAQLGIFVEPEQRKCDSFMVWDMEACLEPLQKKYQRTEMDESIEQRLNKENIEVEYVEQAKGLQVRERHTPATGAITSNIPGCTETRFFHNADPNLLLKEIFAAMIEISDRNFELKQEKYVNEINRLDAMCQQAEAALENADDNNKKLEKSVLKKIQRIKSNFLKQLRQCVVLTFNGGRYDLNLCKAQLFPELTRKVREARNENDGDVDPSCAWPKAITRGSKILSLQTEELKFLDVMLYTGPGTSLDKFIKAFNPGGEQKGSFPYELVRQYEDLERITEFPSRSSFYSTLKGRTISEEEYEEAKTVWNNLPEPRSLLSYIQWYNSRDVEPFLIACENMHKIFFDDFGVDIFQEAQSIPGVCMGYLFKRLHELRPTTRFGLFGPEQGDLCQELYASMTGGLAVIVNRLAEKGKTPIRGNENVPVEKILGLDFNALYLWAMCQDMPTGYPDHWTASEGGFERQSETFEQKLKRRRCHGEVQYLKYAAFRDGVYIHHAEHGAQVKLTSRQWKVDGYANDAKPKPTVYEYFGCHYHSHENGCLNKKLDLTTANKEQSQRDKEKIDALTEAGFNVKVTWECEFVEIKKLAYALRKGYRVNGDARLIEEARTYNRYLEKHPQRKFKGQNQATYQEMFDAIVNGECFGFVKVDIQTPDQLKESLSDFPPIFKHAEVGREHIGDHMRGIAEQLDQLKNPRRCLVNSYFGEQIWLMTPLLEFYHKQGLEITNIHEVCQFDREKAFEWFGKTVTEHRKLGDHDPSKALLGSIYKLLGNSAYGKTITKLHNHMTTYFADEPEVQACHNDPYHHKTVTITDNCYEIHKRKDKCEFNLPMQIGLSVYAWAKLRMLEFIYDVLQEYVPRSCYDFLESDTDSIYLALAKDTLKECVSEDRREEYEKVVEPKWFVMDETQLRTPGLLKTETEGIAFVGLSAKTYTVLVNESGKTKNSAKGVQARNKEILTFANYKSILIGRGGCGTAFNIGIRPMKGSVVTYIQEKSGMTRLYIKRICTPDNRTMPLDL